VRGLNKFINNNYKDLLDVSKKITNNKYPDYEDLLHDILLELYKKDKELIKKLIEKKEIKFYIVKMILNQYHSSTSPFFNKYRKEIKLKNENLVEYILDKKTKHYSNMEVLIENEKKLQWIDKKLANINWFDSQVFKIYYLEEHSLNSLQKATKINRNTLHRSIRIVKKYLKNERDFQKKT
jgi:RNA polymerase sigma factor (sigma-70 family)